jgi:hypothetical protein
LARGNCSARLKDAWEGINVLRNSPSVIKKLTIAQFCLENGTKCKTPQESNARMQQYQAQTWDKVGVFDEFIEGKGVSYPPVKLPLIVGFKCSPPSAWWARRPFGAWFIVARRGGSLLVWF